MGSCRDLGARVTAGGRGPRTQASLGRELPDLLFGWEKRPLQPHPASCSQGNTHLVSPPSLPWHWKVFPAAPGGPRANCPGSPGPSSSCPLTILLLWRRGPLSAYRALSPPPSTRTTAAASWPFLPCLPHRPLPPPPTTPPHISLGPPTSSCRPPSPPPSFSHQHLNPADCPHPLDSRHRT